MRDEIERGSWAFVLKPIDENQTRLIARARGDKPRNLPMKLFHLGAFELAHFIMERKMLLKIKELAEKKGREENSTKNEAQLQNRASS